MDDFNSTESVETQSGEQTGAVASSHTRPQAGVQSATAQSAALSAEESSTEESGASQESVVGSQQNPDFALVSVGEDDGESTPEPDGAGQASESAQSSVEPSSGIQPQQKQTVSQTASENAAYRAMRLRAQREASAAARAELDEELSGLGIPNPYNGNKPFASFQELKSYSEQFQRARIAAEAKRTGRSIAELEEDAANRAFLSSLRREASARNTAAAQAAEQTDERMAYIRADVLDFVKAYPDMDENGLAALENNAQFRRFAGTRFGREPLAKLYGDYLALVGSAGTAAVAKASGRAAKSTGSGTAAGAFLSPAQKEVLDRWNTEHPEMAMTAKEFLGR